ncbi:MAG: GDSL-type esterase/lipase family protein [Roseibacillus sp.]
MKRTVHALLLAAFASLGAASLTAQDTATAPSVEIPATDEGLPGAGPIRRYDWFKNLWRKKRSGWAKRVQEDQEAIVFLGDSITQGWGDTMGGSFPGMKVANRGISGDTTRGMLIRLKEDVLALQPSAVVLLMGTNDLEEGAPPEVIAGNLKRIVAGLKAHDPTMPIVLCKVFPSSARKKRPADQVKKINELYAAAVVGDPQVTVMETWLLFADENGDARKAEFPDLLHPNKAGYAKWAATLRPIFATLGYLETEPDASKLEEGFESLFNGRDLTGWGYRANANTKRKPSPSRPVWKKDHSFDGKKQSIDGRYAAVNGRLVVITPPAGRRFQQIWTTREFSRDFVLKLEFRATAFADSGVFIRKPQLQCRDFLLAGPWKELKNYKPQEWNELVVTVKGNVAHCTCNGEVLDAAMKVPDSGPIGLEGDRGQMEYRRIRIKEM